MKKMYSIILIGCFLSVTTAGCSSSPKAEKESRESEGEHGEEEHEEGNPMEVHLSKEILSKIEIALVPATVKPLYEEIHTTGKVVQDTDQMSYVFSQGAGTVEKIHVSAGETVKKGQALLQIGKQTLTAPRNGTILGINASLGSRVSSMQSLVTLADISTLRVVLDVYPKDIDKIEMGQAVEIQLIGHSDTPFTGKVTYISPSLDNTSQTLKVGAEIGNVDHHLKLGMFVHGKILGKLRGEALVIPEAALVRMDQDFFVFVSGDEEGSFIKRPIQIGARGGGMVEVREGLTASEQVVGKGSFTLKSETMRGGMGEHDH